MKKMIFHAPLFSLGSSKISRGCFCLSKALFYIVFLCAFQVSCGKLFPDKVDVVQLGIVQDFVVASAAPDIVGAKVISDRDYTLAVEGDAPWMSVEQAGRDTIVFSVERNDGFCRSVYVTVSADGRTDRLQLRQEGKWQESISLHDSSVDVPVSGGHVSTRVASNLPSDFLSASTLDSKAIANLSLKDYILSFDVLPTTMRDRKTYSVTVGYTDGWGREISETLTVKQDAYE